MASGTKRRNMPKNLASQYGKWAVVAGASEGLGAAFATQLAGAGLDLVLIARREQPLGELAARLRVDHGVEVVTAALDLAVSDLPSRVESLLASREVGVLVHNAAFAPRGPFAEQALESSLQAIDVNCRSPLVLLHAVLPGMTLRGRGAIVVMSSLTAFQGSPFVSVYGATKAFGLALAEGLWAELSPLGIDVVACCAGATRTPGYLRAAGEGGAPGELDPSVVAANALSSLGKGPFTIPGTVNRVASLLMRRVLPRSRAVRLMGAQAAKLRPPRST